MLFPTAETHPKGTLYLSSYEIAFLQVGYAVSDRAQVTLSIVPLFFTEDPLVPVDLSVKGVLARERRFRFAATASGSGFLGFEQGEAFLGRFGSVAQLCFDDSCRSSANVNAHLVLGGPALLAMTGVGFIARTSDLVALLFEFQSLVPVAREAADVHGVAGAFGVRFSGASWAVDLALDAPLDRRGNLPPVLPLLVGTYRFLP